MASPDRTRPLRYGSSGTGSERRTKSTRTTSKMNRGPCRDYRRALRVGATMSGMKTEMRESARKAATTANELLDEARSKKGDERFRLLELAEKFMATSARLAEQVRPATKRAAAPQKSRRPR